VGLVVVALVLIPTAMVALVWLVLRASLPSLAGERLVPGLKAPVVVRTDRLGIPAIEAQSRLDAIRALGYVTARDRLFQMEMLRRAAAGRLSEVIGRSMLKFDIDQRALGFHRIAPDILARLPEEQRAALLAYADGVNAFLAHMLVPPPEFLALGYRPEPWQPTDSILAGLSMFQQLTRDAEDYERMMTIMDAILPADVVAFLTTDEDAYATVLAGGEKAPRPAQPIPVQALRALLQSPCIAPNDAIVNIEEPFTGSNAWVVGRSKTSDGRAILANDLHLPLSVPNTWYRAMLRYDQVEIGGLVLPGIPMIICGSNGHVAWGLTDINGDFLDLVLLDIHPQHPDQYRTSEGWKQFEVFQESIRIKGGTTEVLNVRQTIWGPVSPRRLLGRPVALRWTALDPAAVDFGLLDIDQATNLSGAVQTIQRFGGPPQNVMLADSSGRIAWTYCGKIPVRRGFDGTVSRSWSDGTAGWEGYIGLDQLPCIIDPPSDVLVTANNRTLGAAYPYKVGCNYANGYRAYRGQQQLTRGAGFTEADMFRLQLDTTSGFYEFYRSLALEVTTPEVAPGDALLHEARTAIAAWDGRADATSVGLGLLIRFRSVLAQSIFGVYLQPCNDVDPEFRYQHYLDTPLRQLLVERIPETLPEVDRFLSWEAFIRDKLVESARQLQGEYPSQALSTLTWKHVNRSAILHPLARALPVLGRWLNMPPDPLPGCAFSIRVAESSNGASARMVVSPGWLEDSLLHMPCGQSGHPLSPHYRDQYSDWLHGQALPFLPGATTRTLILT
jgi:penicillin G amidase